MDTPYTDSFFSGVSGTVQNTASGGLDWLNSTLDNLGNTAVNVFDTQAKIEAIKNQTKTQQAYEDKSQTAPAIGSKNLISGIDNNFLLVGAVGFIGAFMFFKG